MSKIVRNHIIQLEPDNDEVKSTFNIQVETERIRVFIGDCNDTIALTFKSGEDSFKKRERMYKMLDILKMYMDSKGVIEDESILNGIDNFVNENN